MSIKKHVSSLVGVFTVIFTLCGINTSASALADASFIQLSSTNTQLATSKTVNKPLEVRLTSLDGKRGAALSWDRKHPNTITIDEDGVYFIIATAQVGAKEYEPFEGGNIMIWCSMNKKILANSANWVFAGALSRAKALLCAEVVYCKKGDQLGLMFSASATNCGLISYPADPDNELPNAPSVEVSMFKMGG